MKIIDIKESGASNTLLWAISNGANIKEDMPLTSIINNETFYLVTLSGVNLFQLFRLTQSYRDKLRIISESPASIPTMQELGEAFPGGYQSGDDNVSLSELSEHVIKNFINLTSQMGTDDDIIHSGAIRMFLPMITRKFDVQIPIAFIDLIESMDDAETAKLLTHDYPGTLAGIIDADVHGVKTLLATGFVRGTQTIKYDTRYDNYVKLVKYGPLNSYQKSSKLYRFGLLGFAKRDNVSRGELRCNLFKANPVTISTTLKRMSRLSTPLELDFAIELPIQYMQLLENSFSRETLNVAYESSMSSIIDGGITYDDFKTHEYVPNPETDEEDQEKLEARNNSIEAYRMRITEANQILLNSIPILVKSDSDVDRTSIFAMLPSLYTSKAVITINMDNMQKYIGHSDPVISAMFQEISNIANGVVEDIKKPR